MISAEQKLRIISSNADMMELLENGNTPYGLKALHDECWNLARIGKGFRNDRLNKAACKLRNLIEAGQLSENTVRTQLIEACEENRLARDDGLHTVVSTINSGLKKGKQSPRGPANDNDPDPHYSRAKLNIRSAA